MDEDWFDLSAAASATDDINPARMERGTPLHLSESTIEKPPTTTASYPLPEMHDVIDLIPTTDGSYVVPPHVEHKARIL